ncbi:MAG: NAD(P)/FAD-dependent oxidoreductase [Chloroflexi bacterium]|nr:NAD(P)/FAD-dependent oxidoreductase [Chloroflexota bacterium]
MAEEFDVVVIGGGPAGENVAGRVRAGGLTAAVVESELVGGECSYWACMPSKALLRPQEALAVAQRVPSLRGAITGGIDVARALRARNAFASNWNDEGQVQWLASVDATLVRGHGRITGERTVSVTGSDGAVQELSARKAVVVATGTAAAMPPIEGLADSEPWDSRKIVSAQDVPERLIILGGGVIGVEMAQAWRSLGSEVTIVELQDRLLPVEEPAAGEFVAKAFESRGIDVRTGQGVTKVSRDGGTVTATLADGSTVEGTEIVVAVGRAANTRDIGLDSVGLTPGRYIDVDDHLVATGVPGGWLYAIGDVNRRSLLTHMGKYQARNAGDHILGLDVTSWGDNIGSPRVVFTDPQVAATGLTEQQARDKGLNVRVVTYPYGASGGAAAMGEGIDGECKWVVDEDRRTLVGATFVGPGAGELIHAATIAIVGEVTLDRLWHAVPSFPTVSEFWLRFLEIYGL